MRDIQVTALPRDEGTTAWNAVLPPQSHSLPLTDTVHADWLVIGGGFTGLAAARRLHQLVNNDKIVVLESTSVGQGPSGRNAGFMIDVPHKLTAKNYAGSLDSDKKQIEMNRQAMEFAQSAIDEYSICDSVYRKIGKINAASSAKGVALLQSYADHLNSIDEAFSTYDATDLRKITGSEHYQAGVLTPGTVLIQPAAFVRGVATGLKNSGVDIHEKSSVISIDRDGDNYCVKTSHGKVITPTIILAVNGHVQSFGYYQQRLLHLFTYASLSRRLSASEVRQLGAEPFWGIIPADPMGTTVRRISGELYGGDRILIRNRFTCDMSMEITSARIKKVASDHDRSFQQRFPGLKNVSMEYRWGGRLCLSLNGGSAFGEVDKSIFSAACHNGLGTVNGTLAGIVTAELATQTVNRSDESLNAPVNERANGQTTIDKSSLLKEYLKREQPEKLLPKPILSPAVNCALRWKENRAGSEL